MREGEGSCHDEGRGGVTAREGEGSQRGKETCHEGRGGVTAREGEGYWGTHQLRILGRRVH